MIFDLPEAQTMSPAIGVAEHRIEFRWSALHVARCRRASDDRRRGAVVVNDVIENVAILAALGEGLAHDFDDFAAHAETAQS
jgi:hypothetical protein